MLAERRPEKIRLEIETKQGIAREQREGTKRDLRLQESSAPPTTYAKTVISQVGKRHGALGRRKLTFLITTNYGAWYGLCFYSAR